jgi:BlaI family transcriptional regulator, penicillinase repressor
MNHDSPKPTPAELEILALLWRHGPQTVRDLYERVVAGREVGYTTVLKALQVMTEKGLVTRDDSARSHVYQAAVAEKFVKKQMVRDLMDRLFEGSASNLVLQVLSSKPASKAELDRIQQLLDEKRGER